MVQPNAFIVRWLCLLLVSLALLLSRLFVSMWKEREEQRLADVVRTAEIDQTRRARRRRLRDVDLRQDQLCIVCRENPREVILLPCGHVCLCEDCSDKIDSACPACREPIHQRNAAYII